jgi:uncharacterized protein (TIGR02118 family)
MSAHLLVMYPAPKDPLAFERAYREQHLPYAGPRLTAAGATSVVSKRGVAVGGGAPPYHAISDVTFPTMEMLAACASSSGGQEALGHAASISSGGAPTILVVSDDFAS